MLLLHIPTDKGNGNEQRIPPPSSARLESGEKDNILLLHPILPETGQVI